LRVPAFPDELLPHEGLTLPTVWAGNVKVSLVRELPIGFDAREVLDRGARDLDDLPIPERGRPFDRQVHRIALGAGRRGEAVDLVEQRDADRPAGEPARRVGADQGDVAAGKHLVEDLVARVPDAGV